MYSVQIADRGPGGQNSFYVMKYIEQRKWGPDYLPIYPQMCNLLAYLVSESIFLAWMTEQIIL